MSTDATRPGLRERKARRTQRAIVRATAELTLEIGFDAATIAKIAERADVAPRTVSLWFPVKDDILFAGAVDRLERLERHLGASGGGTITDRLERWLSDEAAWQHEAEDEHELHALRHRAVLTDPRLRAREQQLFAPVRDLVARSVAHETGTRPEAIGPQMIAAATLGFLFGLRDLIAVDRPDPSAQAFAEQKDLGLTLLQATYDALRRALADA